ncbi:hypothetical protein N7489_009859 [Penicillium chrysogenum]|uniref:uncharacterized protein n=1 Tax=Penicillium chrysogenum TaxID=5076 RepID=UPI00239C1B87|nr:uncharacterized protein N7489_009859 [Penicillium chrysogenum]KAJ5229151.1 hypothetical protein N7489_009859 [Penicillium chrysogenum]KAJ5258552.1 hypothetical protein N7524_010108 [Penicillium chrysogenum]KAJ6169024.1 hypothetical protein N7497_001867 [Penicillium chrysogenum]
MSTELPLERQLVVRCDRRDPCGNCQDAGISCNRRRAVKRKCLSTRPRGSYSPRSSHSARRRATPDHQSDQGNSTDAVLPVLRSVPSRNFNDLRGHKTGVLYDPVYDAQITIQHQLCHLPGLTLDRRSVLETALSVIRVLSDNSRALVQDSINHQVEVHPRGPSIEFLTWMLKDLRTDRFGTFVADYFRHISIPKLKQMGLELLRNNIPIRDSVIYTVCVNSVAYKFITTVVNLEEDSDVALELRKNATGYRAAAQAALKQIPLLIPPSLGLLQAIICGIFLHQGSGDVDLSGDLTKAACNTCIDLDLQTKVLSGNASEEELFCFLWCYTLDRNHAFKSRTSRCLLDVQLPPTFSDLYPTDPPMAEHFLIYLDLARVQDTVVSYLPDSSSSHHNPSLLHGTGEYMLLQMQYIEQRMNHMASLSSEWKGLDSQTEMSALKFAYQSIMTGILYLLQSDPGQPTSSTESYLQSARRELSALVSMCHSAEKQTAVNFLNWTILLYPATAYLILFCNVVATSDIGDFNLMKAIAECLTQTGISYPLVQLRTLYQKFLGLSQEFFNDERNAMQRIGSPQLGSPFPNPVGSPFAITWGADDLLFDQFIFTGAESFSGMLSLPEIDPSLPYSFD